MTAIVISELAGHDPAIRIDLHGIDPLHTYVTGVEVPYPLTLEQAVHARAGLTPKASMLIKAVCTNGKFAALKTIALVKGAWQADAVVTVKLQREATNADIIICIGAFVAELDTHMGPIDKYCLYKLTERQVASLSSVLPSEKTTTARDLAERTAFLNNL